MDVFLKIYPVASNIVGSGEAFFVVDEPVMSVSFSPVKLPLWPVPELHYVYQLIFFGDAYNRSYTGMSCLICLFQCVYFGAMQCMVAANSYASF